MEGEIALSSRWGELWRRGRSEKLVGRLGVEVEVGRLRRSERGRVRGV